MGADHEVQVAHGLPLLFQPSPEIDVYKRQVERKPHPTDGRQMNIELTAKGAAVRNSARDAKRTWLAQAIAQLDEEERETLFRAGELMKRLVEK